ncbi:MAG: Xaa-Pro peptidase family protein [Planctomycetota bacterium]|nr:Xaa-Pro peptidase family protein [Planctomycetota bacterium]
MLPYQARCDKLRKLLKKSNYPGLLVSNRTNVTYLTGFTGEDSFLLVMPDGEVLITDPRFTEQVEQECPGLEMHVRLPGVSMSAATGRACGTAKLGRLAIEGDSLTVSARDRLADQLPKVELATSSGLVETLRTIKDKSEIAAIRQAVRMAEEAFTTMRGRLSRGESEKQYANGLEAEMRRAGAKGASFETIVAVGARSALPHARPTGKLLSEAGFVLIDWGADGGLYKSDLTRFLVTAKISPKLERVYGVVLKAQLAAIEAIRPGVSCADVDAVARKIIADAGFGKRFGHGLGHGLGLDVHEAPRLSQGQATLLEPGMVVTVEPGIYLPGWGGVRIEDDVLVTRNGHEVLTSLPKSWEECFI